MADIVNEHAVLAPSSAGVWVYCAGSVKAQARYPQAPTQDTEEGTASHWVGAEVLTSYQSSVITCEAFIGATAPNGIVITQEIADGADELVKDVLQIAQEQGLMRALRIEQRVSINRVHPENWGTPDVWAYDVTTNTLYVWDYKFGHKRVEVHECWQLIDYAIGCIDEITGGNGIADQELKVVLRIIQPRYFHGDRVTEWHLTASDLRGYANRLSMAANEALGDNPTFTTGPHCEHCTARHTCEGAQMAAMAAIDVVNRSVHIAELPPHALGLELVYLERAKEAIDARLTGLKAQAEGQMMQGKMLPGWGFEQTRGRKTWKNADKEVIAMGAVLGFDLRKQQPITPSQAIKLGIDEQVINPYIKPPQTGLKLVRDDGTKAKRVFSKRI